MAKKKTQTKKHKFKHAEPLATVSAATSAVAPEKPTLKMRPQTSFGASYGGVQRDFSYVAKDVRKIALLAVSLVVLELLLWFFFTRTAIGVHLYSSVNV